MRIAQIVPLMDLRPYRGLVSVREPGRRPPRRVWAVRATRRRDIRDKAAQATG
jgi:hypothetical protein